MEHFIDKVVEWTWVLILALFGWIWRTESRMNILSTNFEALKKQEEDNKHQVDKMGEVVLQLTNSNSVMTEKLNGIKSDMTRIDTKLDRLIDNLLKE